MIKYKANASKHHALSWEHACKLEQQFKDEVEELTRLAEQADADEIREEMNISDELGRRKDRLAAVDEAKAKMEERAAQRFAQEQKEYEEKAASRRAKAEASGKKPHGPEPKPPAPGSRKRDQVNLTDEESRTMLSSDKGFVQAFNAQTTVDNDTMIIVKRNLSVVGLAGTTGCR
ncbi:hypothetical protein [Desulfocastanea catecholica]